MKEITRYKFINIKWDTRHKTAIGHIEIDERGFYTEYSNYEKVSEENEQLQARIKELESAERTLLHLGYQNLGGEMWKPPINKPNPLITDEKLRDEIKAQGIDEAITLINTNQRFGFEGFAAVGKDTVILELKQQVRKLRTKHG